MFVMACREHFSISATPEGEMSALLNRQTFISLSDSEGHSACMFSVKSGYAILRGHFFSALGFNGLFAIIYCRIPVIKMAAFCLAAIFIIRCQF